jgi:hypothetical protein
LAAKNWLITVNPLAASGKANVGGSPNAWGLIALTNREVQLVRLRVANMMRLGFSKANARFLIDAPAGKGIMTPLLP